MDTPEYRPAFHFSPRRHWLNDPNGLVYADGRFHLCFQHHPRDTSWGPMHWGHAVSEDLLCWQELPLALAPDALGMIFSGCVVVDRHDSCGLGQGGGAPWVAVYTQHDAAAAEAGSDRFQHQSLAVSLDEGLSWTPYAGNPVLPNPGLKDFRDPKVFWHAPTGRWVMVLAAGDHVRCYGSPDLRRWTLLSCFGGHAGAHGGVWECPDLVSLQLDGRRRWVLIVSLMPGGPNGGSGTQYFVGDFDGTTFTPEHRDLRWLDHGPDHYAFVTWHHTGERVLGIGWMSNWAYAARLPTAPWRGAMALPRELGLRCVGGETLLLQQPAAEVRRAWQVLPARRLSWSEARLLLDEAEPEAAAGWWLEIVADALPSFVLRLGSPAGDELTLGFDAADNAWWIDRRRCGLVDFDPAFVARLVAVRRLAGPPRRLEVWLDRCSVELFADDGLAGLVALVFPRRPFDELSWAAPQAPPGATLTLRRWSAGRALAGRLPLDSSPLASTRAER